MTTALLEIRGLRAFYGDFQALFDLDVEIANGETIAIIGANGAGKTTFLRAIMGALPSAPEMVRFEGRPIGDLPAHEVVRLGIAMVPEGRKLFKSLSVEENLRIGGDYARAGPWTLDRIYQLFPVLAERRNTPATALSGGQQQMTAIGRALMSNPRILLCDELSLGLAPMVIRDIYERLAKVRAEGTTLVIVEQDINRALEAADRFYCFQKGRVSLAGTPSTIDRSAITAAYFGIH
jgi:branched-chain amino acid transport system ATP-binding protein